MSNILELPYTDNYIQNRIIRLRKELLDSNVDHIDPIVSVLLRHLEGTKEIEDNNDLQDCFNSLYAALLSYRQFTGDIKVHY